MSLPTYIITHRISSQNSLRGRVIFRSDNTLVSCFRGESASCLFQVYSHWGDKAPSAPVGDGGYWWHVPEASAFGPISLDHFPVIPPSFLPYIPPPLPLLNLSPPSFPNKQMGKLKASGDSTALLLCNVLAGGSLFHAPHVRQGPFQLLPWVAM